MPEKRMFERLVVPIRVKYSIIGDQSNTGESRDISGGGIRISLMEKLNKGTMVKLKFEVPGVEEPIQVLGKVIWSRQIIITGKDEKIYFDTGINFHNENPLKLAKIMEYFKFKTEGEQENA